MPSAVMTLTQTPLNREGVLETLLQLLEKGLAAPSFVHIVGPADSGKTMLLKRLLSEGRLGAALYIDALECITMTNIYERVLAHALAQSAKRSVATRSRSGQSTRPCSTVAEFVTRLAALEWAATEKTFVLIDEPERLLQLDSHAFSVLLRLPELLTHRIGLVLASREPFEALGTNITTGLHPITITLSGYSNEELKSILVRQMDALLAKNGLAASSADIHTCVTTVQQVATIASRDLTVLRGAAWSVISSAAANKSKLPLKLAKCIQERLDASNRPDTYHNQARNASLSLARVFISHVVEELDTIERHLLVSAFIASFQGTREDIRVFGEVVLNKTKGRKRQALMSKETAGKKTDKLVVQLPKLFDQTRLLAIFYFLVDGLAFLPSVPQLQTSVRSLCDRGLLRGSNSSIARIDGLRYRVNVSREFALALAASINLDLYKLSTISQ